MSDEYLHVVHPIVGESVAHNARTISNIRTLTSPVLGFAAGALSLESTWGFVFFLAGTLLTSLLVFLGPAQQRPQRYFGAGAGAQASPWAIALEVALGGMGIEAFMGFVMSWTLAFNLVAT